MSFPVKRPQKCPRNLQIRVKQEKTVWSRLTEVINFRDHKMKDYHRSFQATSKSNEIVFSLPLFSRLSSEYDWSDLWRSYGI